MRITVEVGDITNKYTMREYVGKGSFGEHEIELSVALPTMSPIVKIDGKMYMVDIHDITRAIAEQVVGD